MTLDALIILAGAFVLLEPHLGFPNSWDTWLLSLTGIFVVALGIAVRRRGLKERVEKRMEAAPAENANA